jgi:Ca-activated chloride channel family protein
MADHIDSELRSTLSRTAPASNPVARAAAMALAMESFDGAQKKSAGGQGSKAALRFMDVFNLIGSPIMKHKYLLASVAMVIVAAPLAFSTLTTTYSLGDPGSLTLQGGASFEETPSAVAKAPAAPKPAAVPRSADAKTATNEKLAAMQLAITEAMRLSTGQMQGNVREQTGAAYSLADQQDTRAVQLAIQDAMQARYEPTAPTSAATGGRFTSQAVNGMKSVASEPVSTFSIDVDTASYAFARRSIENGYLPDPASVRVEEFVNYFDYDYAGARSADEPFQPSVTVVPTPWNPNTKLVHIGLRGYEAPVTAQKPANLVFLIDVSGSMQSPDRLMRLQTAFQMLVETLKPTDTMSIVTYADGSRVVLEPTPASDKERITRAINGLRAGGGTNGGDGLMTAYRLAEENFRKDGVNRIFLGTDGDFNIGATGDEDLLKLVERKRKSGVFLSVLGVGMGNYNDGMMQTIAQNGNGVAAYIDNLSEARKVMHEEAAASIFPIAKDVKVQVEFNPQTVAKYRLIGYETRALATEDFNNDKVDAGEVGSGHRVTAIYEIVEKGSPEASVDDSRYSKPDEAAAPDSGGHNGELAFLKIRYKKPEEDKSRLITRPILDSEALQSIEAASQDVKFSIGAAAFAQKLKHEPWVEDYDWKAVEGLMQQGKGADPYALRGEAIRLAQIAGTLAKRDDAPDLPR